MSMAEKITYLKSGEAKKQYTVCEEFLRIMGSFSVEAGSVHLPGLDVQILRIASDGAVNTSSPFFPGFWAGGMTEDEVFFLKESMGFQGI